MIMNREIYLLLSLCLLPLAAEASPAARSLPPVLVESGVQSSATPAEPSKDFLKATRIWMKEEDARVLARKVMRQDPAAEMTADKAEPVAEPAKTIETIAALPVPKTKATPEDQSVELLPPEENEKQAKTASLESVYVEPKKVVEKSRFDGKPQAKGKPISEAIAEDRARKQDAASKKIKLATPSAKPQPTSVELAEATVPAPTAQPPASPSTSGRPEDKPQPKTIRVAAGKKPDNAVQPQQIASIEPVTRSPDATVIKRSTASTKNLAMVPLSPGSYIIPPDMEMSAQQLAAVAPAAAPPAQQVASIGKVTYSVFTSNVVDRAPQGRIAKASVSQGTLTYFSVVENLNGQYLIHRWERDGKVLFDKPFAVANSPSSAWSSLPLTPELVGNISVKIMDQAGHQLGSDRIEVIP